MRESNNEGMDQKHDTKGQVKCPKGEHTDAGWGKAVLRNVMKRHAELTEGCQCVKAKQ